MSKSFLRAAAFATLLIVAAPAALAEGERACFVYPDLGSGACRQIYVEDGVYKNVADGTVRAHWMPMP